jgi:hypothetical protein
MEMIVGHEESFKRDLEAMREKAGIDTDISAEEVRQSVLNGEIRAEATEQFTLQMVVQSVERYAEIFYAMNWVFTTATNNIKFFTCDAPVFYFDPAHDYSSFYGTG